MYFISWDDCIQLCEKLNRNKNDILPEGYKFSLPTEAQWEYTCKSFSNTKIPLDSIAWYRNNSNKQVHPVGEKLPNALGIYDLRGNLSEWCYDWFSEYKEGEKENPMGSENGEKKIVRGGSWFGSELNTKATTRFQDPPKNGYSSIGLRLALRTIN